MTKHRTATLALIASLGTAPALAVQVPMPEDDSEPRVRSTPHSLTQMIQVRVPALGQTMIVLAPGETKMDILVSTDLWRADSSGNAIVVSAKPGAPTTDMHVVGFNPDGSVRHRYQFELIPSPEPVRSPIPLVTLASNDLSLPAPAPSPQPAFNPVTDGTMTTVRMTYDDEEDKARADAAAATKRGAASVLRARRAAYAETVTQARLQAMLQDAAAHPAIKRCNFKWKGDANLLPQSACNLGSSTAFFWPGQQPVPAILAVTPDGFEHSTTSAPSADRPGLVTVQQISQRWRFRIGTKLVADISDVTFSPTGSDTQTNTISPLVRTRVQVPSAAGGTP